MRTQLIAILSIFMLITAFRCDDEQECKQLFKAQTPPRDCCNYPSRYILPKHQEKCKKSCENIKDDTGGCCFLNCNYYQTGVVRNLKFEEKALLELYENYLMENGGGKFDQWLPIVEKSIETCQKLFPKADKLFTCDIPEYVLDIMDCIPHFNFVNCPSFKDSRECDDLKKFVETSDQCGKKVNETFIIDFSFFDVAQ